MRKDLKKCYDLEMHGDLFQAPRRMDQALAWRVEQCLVSCFQPFGRSSNDSHVVYLFFCWETTHHV